MTFATGLSALRANQTALSVVGNNIANASTPGYRRQSVLFVENPHVEQGGFSIGTGVSIGDIRQAGDAVLEAALRTSTSNGGMLSSRLQSAKEIESLFLPGTGTIQERADELFLQLERLSALPTEATLRSAVVHSAAGLSDEINRVADALNSMTASTGLEIEQTIADIEAKAGEVAKLNAQVIEIENSGKESFGLKNQRDVLVGELAQLIDVERRVNSDGGETYLIGGGLFDVSSGLSDMKLVRNELGQLEIWKEGCDKPHKIGGGKLGGLLAQNNEPGGIESLKQKLNEFVSGMTHFLDAAHATGVGIGGAFTDLSSGRSVEEPSAPLATQDTAGPVFAGKLYISVDDEATGQSTLIAVEIDPTVDSLADVATKISSVDHLSASIDSTGKIAIVASSGFTFDFTGNLQSTPDNASISGTVVPTISGRYSGEANEEYSFRFIGSGTVGVSEPLQIEVMDKSGLTVGVHDIGSDYEPTSDLAIGNGVFLSLSSGSAVDSDTFIVELPAMPDETGILSAMGLNTLFVGRDATSLRVNPLIQDNPSLLATTTNGDPSDTRNLHRMINVRDALTMRDGTITLEQFLADMAAAAGQEVDELTQDVQGHEEQHAFLEGEFDLIAGVDVNEELARMLQYQTSYQAAARYIASVDEMLRELFAIIR